MKQDQNKPSASTRIERDTMGELAVPVEAYFYEGANHAFNNDTSVERYNKAVADLAWSRTVALFIKALS